MNCPNCNKEFVEHRESAFRCEDCGWLMEIDGRWVTCPEPVEPERLPEPEPEPEPIKDIMDEGKNVVTKYFGGLITVTEVEDENDENDN